MAGDAAENIIEIYEDERYTRSIRFDKLCKVVNIQGCIIKRYDFEVDRAKFVSNSDVSDLVLYAGIEMLPVTCVNNHLMKIETYPTRAELELWLKTSNGGYENENYR